MAPSDELWRRACSGCKRPSLKASSSRSTSFYRAKSFVLMLCEERREHCPNNAKQTNPDAEVDGQIDHGNSTRRCSAGLTVWGPAQRTGVPPIWQPRVVLKSDARPTLLAVT